LCVTRFVSFFESFEGILIKKELLTLLKIALVFKLAFIFFVIIHLYLKQGVARE